MEPDIGLANWFFQRAQRTPERRAMTFEGETWTYAQMQRRIDTLAGRLRKLGAGLGTRVAFLGLNQPVFFFAMFAAARIGATFVPLNFRLTGPELAMIIEDSGAHTLIVDEQHRSVIDGLRKDIATVVNFVTVGDAVGWLPLDGAEEPVIKGVRVAPDDVAIIMYTSGTTGRAKGAMLTHANLWWNNINAIFNLARCRLM
jgi:fatty-acyl-CoA synthase